ncbi:hypothetical protein [Novosphingobium sediminicola]|uniref:Neutral/alkaline non-lysosomal ceramidase N-terminal domain-containing protein n=1 Tax=Novosphingobium sediminicola TaxID=563162 RepID=A0A7W6CDB1_9SPHN|nr:hypothetical protein [Novosphingobium sediminicola]MBB3954436.1 hypothetical protein [Novosphingobium sediminicola]
MKTALSLALLATVAATPVIAGDLRAGAARVSITPPADAFPYASPSSPNDKPFVGVHDDIFTRALVLEDGSKRIVLVSIENVNVPEPAAMVSALAQAAHVPPAQVMVFATHTHSNPLVFFHGHTPSPRQAQELERTQKAAVAAVGQAIAGLAPARISFVRSRGWVNINNGEASTGVKTGDPAAASDKSLDVVQVTGADGRRIALLVDYASHAEVMFRSMTRPDGLEVTGDLPGTVSRLLEDNAAAPVVLYAAGAEGDQLSQYKSLQADAGGLPAKDEGAGGWAILDVQARSLAASVVDALKSAPAPAAQVSLGAAAGQAVCPGVKRARDANNGVVESPAGDVVIPLSLVRLGPVTLAGVGADLGTVLGQGVKDAFAQPTSVVTMTAGAVGYVLDDAAYARATHAVMGSPVRPGCARDAIVGGLKALAKGL